MPATRKLSELSDEMLDATEAATLAKGYRFVTIGLDGRLYGNIDRGIPTSDIFREERERRAAFTPPASASSQSDPA